MRALSLIMSDVETQAIMQHLATNQVPPAPYDLPAPILNPSSSLVVPQPHPVPVSPGGGPNVCADAIPTDKETVASVRITACFSHALAVFARALVQKHELREHFEPSNPLMAGGANVQPLLNAHR